MLEWLSDNRAFIAVFLIIGLAASFFWSIYTGVRQTRMRENEEVFGDPERTKGGWYWALCGMAALLLVWFYYSWGVARAFFPTAANELCQVAKVEEAISPISAALPVRARHLRSTILINRNSEQLDVLEDSLPADVFSVREITYIGATFSDLRALIAVLSDPGSVDPAARTALGVVQDEILALARRLDAGHVGYVPTGAALAQPAWGTSEIEIPALAMTSRGMLFEDISRNVMPVAEKFLGIRNRSPAADALVASIGARIAQLRASEDSVRLDARGAKQRKAFVKALDRIYKRLDDGTIFPAEAMGGVDNAVAVFLRAVDDAKGGLGFVEAVFTPGGDIVKSRTRCTEQGPGRWLPKPLDVIAQFSQLANPDIEAGGGYKGTRLLWWKWLGVADVVGFFIPDGLVDMLPGSYGAHGHDGTFEPTYKDRLLAVAQGEVYLGSIPMLDGHIWDSVFRVLVAMGFGILLGVPLGIYMGVSRFFKSFFDPMIELYRPVPPLAWAPLILTIFGIQDDGKIFLLFMVSFAIMVISARTGASGTQLSKIRAAHSLGATNGQILRHVILPNALPEILTGVRISIGVCWGTLVAAEMLAGTTGIGFIENVARTVSDYELIWVTILIMGLLGLLFDIAMRWLISILIPWRGKG